MWQLVQSHTVEHRPRHKKDFFCEFMRLDSKILKSTSRDLCSEALITEIQI